VIGRKGERPPAGTPEKNSETGAERSHLGIQRREGDWSKDKRMRSMGQWTNIPEGPRRNKEGLQERRYEAQQQRAGAPKMEQQRPRELQIGEPKRKTL
jgi:hypothetical protein